MLMPQQFWNSSSGMLLVFWSYVRNIRKLTSLYCISFLKRSKVTGCEIRQIRWMSKFLGTLPTHLSKSLPLFNVSLWGKIKINTVLICNHGNRAFFGLGEPFAIQYMLDVLLHYWRHQIISNHHSVKNV